MTVLYAEDDIEDLDVFFEVLHQINPAVTCINARDGAETLQILENAATLPDYIFLDINMPTLDGKSCLKFIKKDSRFNSIPVIVYTTSRDPRDIEMCKQLGATEYIKKPNSIQEAVASLSRFFSVPSAAV